MTCTLCSLTVPFHEGKAVYTVSDASVPDFARHVKSAGLPMLWGVSFDGDRHRRLVRSVSWGGRSRNIEALREMALAKKLLLRRQSLSMTTLILAGPSPLPLSNLANQPDEKDNNDNTDNRPEQCSD